VSFAGSVHSLLSKLPYRRLDRRVPAEVATDDFFNRSFLPRERFGDLPHGEPGYVELGRSGSAQIIEVQIAIGNVGVELGLVERGAETVNRPGRFLLLVRTVVARFGTRARTSRNAG
jgi:hypothetical protein